MRSFKGLLWVACWAHLVGCATFSNLIKSKCISASFFNFLSSLKSKLLPLNRKHLQTDNKHTWYSAAGTVGELGWCCCVRVYNSVVLRHKTRSNSEKSLFSVSASRLCLLSVIRSGCSGVALRGWTACAFDPPSFIFAGKFKAPPRCRPAVCCVQVLHVKPWFISGKCLWSGF